jgi:heme oxygenase
MSRSPFPDSQELARYLEARGELGKPWMWHLLRLTKLKESKGTMPEEEYMRRLQEAHADLMRLGEFWKGREQEVFSGVYTPATVLEPLPGSPEDR